MSLHKLFFLIALLGLVFTAAPRAQAKTWSVARAPETTLTTALVMPVTSSKPSSLAIADMIFQDRFQFVDFLKDVFVFPGGKINYDAQPQSSADSNWLWMQSLTPISFLCNAYESKRDTKYLKRAFPILKDWEDYEARGKNKFLWYDHSAANRTHTLIYLYVLANREKLMDEPTKRHFVELLARHCEFLADPANYTQYNHGVMMDKALLLASLFLKDSLPQESKAWLETAQRRIIQDFDRDFTPSMVHIENSPAYHFYVTKHFEQMCDLMNFYKVEVPANFRKRLQQAQDYARLITMPNGQLPLIGDTNEMVSPTAPSLASAVHPDAGVAVFCAPTSPSLNSVWMLFKSGYLTPTHKHADDLSFVLYAGGHDIFPGGGLLNYQEGEPLTKFIKGAVAHNTLVVDGMSYPLQTRTLETTAKVQWTMFPQSGLTGYGLDRDLNWVTGFNTAYGGVRLERTLAFLKPNLVVLYDSAVSSNTHQYSQLFRIAAGLRLSRMNDREMVINAEKAPLEVSLAQLLPADSALYNGDREATRGFASPKFDTPIPEPQAEYSVKGARGEFLTVIGIGLTPAQLAEKVKTSISVAPASIRLRSPLGATVEIPRR